MSLLGAEQRRLFHVSYNVSGQTSHFGSGNAAIGAKGVQEYLHSDSLFSALCNEWAKIFGRLAIDELIQAFLGSSANGAGPAPPFRLSSLFVNHQGTDFVPKPLLPVPGLDSEDRDIRHLSRQQSHSMETVEFISISMLREWLELFSQPAPDTDITRYETFYENILHFDRFYRSSHAILVEPNIAMDHPTRGSQLFHQEATYYAPETWLYFIAEVEPGYASMLEQAALSFGVMEHLGGKKSGGYGKSLDGTWSELADEDWSFLLQAHSDPGLSYLLGLYHPTEPERAAIFRQMPRHAAGYALIQRSGWTDSPFFAGQEPKKIVRMFAEGSVLPAPNPRGSLVRVTPRGWREEIDTADAQSTTAKHDIYRFSMPLTITIADREPK